jgi:hypothetical protein
VSVVAGTYVVGCGTRANQVPLTKDVLEAAYKNRQGLKFEELDAKDIKHTIIETPCGAR